MPIKNPGLLYVIVKGPFPVPVLDAAPLVKIQFNPPETLLDPVALKVTLLPWQIVVFVALRMG